MQKQLHPKSRWVFRFRGFFGALAFTWVAGWLLFGIFSGFNNLETQNPFDFFTPLNIILWALVVIIIMESYARLSYNNWFYEFTADNLRLERGIIWKRYSNVPYERVQNVDIKRGVFARLFGFSEVDIQTAGYSGAQKRGWAEGYIPGVDVKEAEEIREFLMKKIGKRSKGGL